MTSDDEILLEYIYVTKYFTNELSHGGREIKIKVKRTEELMTTFANTETTQFRHLLKLYLCAISFLNFR